MNKNNNIGRLSALATLIFFMLAAWKTEAFAMILSDIVLLVSGEYQRIAVNNTTFLMMLPVILGVIALDLVCSISAVIMQNILLGKPGRHALVGVFEKIGEGNHFFTFFVVVLLEELFARWLFLGVLVKIPFLSGTVGFYVLFFLGNAIWALLHLANYLDTNDRKLLRVLPQFIGGIFFTYVFVKYGLFAAILTHFGSNAVVFATHKVRKFSLADFLAVIYTILCGVVSFYLMEKPLADILLWFGNQPLFALPGWGFWDYVKVSVFLTSCIIVVFEVMLYDQAGGSKKKLGEDYNVTHMAIGIIAIVGIMFGLYWLSGFFMEDVPYRVLIVAIIFCFLQKGASGSAIARTFWSGLPDAYFTICILQAIGFWPSLGWLAVEIVVSLPRMLLYEQE